MEPITALLFVGAMYFGGHNLQERVELCKHEHNKYEKECDFIYEDQCKMKCSCEKDNEPVKVCERKLIGR